MFNLFSKKRLKLYRITYEFREDGDDSWEEVIVSAVNKNDAINACGFTAYPRDQVFCECIGVAGKKLERGVVCSGIHNYEPFEFGDEVKLGVDFFPYAKMGTIGVVRGCSYKDNKKYIYIEWYSGDSRWRGQEDGDYNACWFDYAREPEER